MPCLQGVAIQLQPMGAMENIPSMTGILIFQEKLKIEFLLKFPVLKYWQIIEK